MRQHTRKMRQMHSATLWVHFAAMLVGAWLIASPATLGMLDAANVGVRAAEVTAERGLAPIALRQQWLAWSDLASGALAIAFATLSLSWRHRWAQWGTCAVGLWLVCAPLLFWAPSAAVYANDTLCGALLVAFSILVPMMPGMGHEAMAEPASIPAGWDYSPSTWSQRLPIIALAFVGFFIARYLAAYQLGHIDSVWDPLFGDGTRRVITSDVSHAWPVADAGLGAASYLVEALSGIMGDRRRWRTMPWMVAMFGVLVIPLGGVSIFFIVIQPIVIGTWCTLCLISAAAMVIMLPYSFDEVVAMFQFLAREKRRGASIWRAFWRGGADTGGRTEEGPPLALDAFDWRALGAASTGLPKALLLSAVLGLWLMLSRILFGHAGPMADSDHLVGALVFTFSVCAFAEVARPLRALNIPLGGWLVISPWVLDGATVLGTVGVMAAGVILVVLAFPRGPVLHRYAGWDRALAW